MSGATPSNYCIVTAAKPRPIPHLKRPTRQHHCNLLCEPGSGAAAAGLAPLVLHVRHDGRPAQAQVHEDRPAQVPVVAVVVLHGKQRPEAKPRAFRPAW